MSGSFLWRTFLRPRTLPSMLAFFPHPRASSAYTTISRARDTFFEAIHPLLRVIGSYAGCHVSLIVGDVQKDETKDEFFAV